MADTVSLPVVSDNGFGGNTFGAGVLGFLVGSMWNGGFGGWGNGRLNGQVGADISLANAVEHVSDQVTQGNISALQTAANQNMFMGNLVNQTGDQITAAVNQGTMSGMQSIAQLSSQLCGMESNLNQSITANTFSGMQNTNQINERLCCINNNITTQGYENLLQSQALTSQLAQQHAELSRQIFEENCKDRELQREIQSQAVRDQLAQAQANNAALTAQINLTNQLTAQTAYLVQQLGTTAATARATTSAS